MQNDTIDNLRLDINKYRVRACVYVRENDTRSRTLHITLANNGIVYSLDNLMIAELLIHKPDGSENDQAMVQYGNEVQYTLRTMDINIPGECKCQVMLTFKDGTIITSPEFSIMVYQKTIDPQLEKSTNEYTALSQMMVDMQGASALAQEASNIAQEAATTAQDVLTRAETAVEVIEGGISTVIEKAGEVQANADDVADALTEVRELSATASESAADAHSDMLATSAYKDDAEGFSQNAQQSAQDAETALQSAQALVDSITPVTVTQLQTEGVHIANISVGENVTEIYAPEGGTGASTWDEVADKPFDTVGNNLLIANGVLMAKEVMLTQAEYDALPDTKLSDGVKYYITDAPSSSQRAGMFSNAIGAVLTTVEVQND